MNVRLVFEKKKKRIWVAKVHGPIATLGRAHGCTIRIPSSEVSRLHCRVRLENGYVTVEDLESVNGTFVNGRRVHSVQTVRPGDRLSLGAVHFVVEYELPPGVELPPPEDEELPVLEVEDDIEIVEEPDAVPVLPVAEPIDDVEDLGNDLIVLDEEDQLGQVEVDELGDFVIDLDEADDHPNRY
jgi:pSer/pThr/pTyr-binding forkhead associated (FHA) protein